VGFVVAVAATLYLRDARDRAEMLEQSRLQHEELTRRLDGLERFLAVARDPVAVLPASPPGSSPAPRDGVNKEVARTVGAAGKPPDYAERIQAGNAIVDHAIQDGRWNTSDMVSFGVATNGLTAEDRGAMMARLSVAVNGNQVKLDLRPPAP
jgi:hypothetical protein